MSKPFSSIKSALGLDDTLPFGRHQGYTVLEIVRDRPEYIKWLIDNTSLRFYPSVHIELERFLVDKKENYNEAYYRGLNFFDIHPKHEEWNYWDDVPF